MAIRVRLLTEEEREQLQRLAHARNVSYSRVQRAKIILLNSQGLLSPAVSEQLHLQPVTVRKWIKRFNESGLKGLEDLPRPGRGGQRPEALKSEVVTFARTKPSNLGFPFEVWTIERLQTAILKGFDVKLSTETIWSWLKAEGLRWQRQQSWLRPVLNTPKAIEEFEEKRGPLSNPTFRPKKFKSKENMGLKGSKGSSE
jgi:transposase